MRGRVVRRGRQAVGPTTGCRRQPPPSPLTPQGLQRSNVHHRQRLAPSPTVSIRVSTAPRRALGLASRGGGEDGQSCRWIVCRCGEGEERRRRADPSSCWRPTDRLTDRDQARSSSARQGCHGTDDETGRRRRRGLWTIAELDAFELRAELAEGTLDRRRRRLFGSRDERQSVSSLTRYERRPLTTTVSSPRDDGRAGAGCWSGRRVISWPTRRVGPAASAKRSHVELARPPWLSVAGLGTQEGVIAG